MKLTVSGDSVWRRNEILTFICTGDTSDHLTFTVVVDDITVTSSILLCDWLRGRPLQLCDWIYLWGWERDSFTIKSFLWREESWMSMCSPDLTWLLWEFRPVSWFSSVRGVTGTVADEGLFTPEFTNRQMGLQEFIYQSYFMFVTFHSVSPKMEVVLLSWWVALVAPGSGGGVDKPHCEEGLHVTSSAWTQKQVVLFTMIKAASSHSLPSRSPIFLTCIVRSKERGCFWRVRKHRCVYAPLQLRRHVSIRKVPKVQAQEQGKAGREEGVNNITCMLRLLSDSWVRVGYPLSGEHNELPVKQHIRRLFNF